MKLARYDAGNGAELGVVEGDAVIALNGLSGRYPTMLSVIEGGAEALDAVRAHLATNPRRRPLGEVKLLAPIERPSKFLAIGMNYAKHADEARRLGVAVPDKQLWFNKQTSCLSGPFDPIEPGVTEQLDYEVELGAIIGKTTKGASAAEAPASVFGYVVVNDVSARDWQRHSQTMTMGKSFDTHGPVGPWIVTADEIGNPHTLGLRCFVNGELRQDASTDDLIHDLWAQIAYLSTAFTLFPGDIIATGTPSGVGVAMTPPVFLKSGDVVRCEIDNIGAIENRVA